MNSTPQVLKHHPEWSYRASKRLRKPPREARNKQQRQKMTKNEDNKKHLEPSRMVAKTFYLLVCPRVDHRNLEANKHASKFKVRTSEGMVMGVPQALGQCIK